MRRKTGIVIGACAALVLAGTAGTLVSLRTGGSPAGWYEAPGPTGTPVAERDATSAAAAPRVVSDPHVVSDPLSTSAAPGSTVASSTSRAPVFVPDKTVTKVEPPKPGTAERPIESATSGREKIGSLVRVDEELEYSTGPKRQEFAYPGASYVKVHFDQLEMLPGDYVTVSNPSGTESYRYESIPDDRWAMSITGDTAVVEMHRRTESVAVDVVDDMGIGIDKVARGDRRTPPAGPGHEESVCGSDTSADAICYESKDPVAYTKSKAVARLLINGTELCTAWRVGPKNRMITNNHCLSTSSEAYDTEVWFNYQCAKCGGYDVFKPTKVWGDQVLATDKTYDYTLFSVDGFASIEKFGFLALDTSRPRRGEELYVPQHPAGEPAKIAGSKGDAAGTCAVDNPDYTGYAAHSDVSYFCDTAGGSSGSPVISRATNKVVALHHFGGCPNSGVRGDLLAGKLRALL